MNLSLHDKMAVLLGAAVVLPVNGYEVDGLTPQAVVRPGDRHQVAEVLRWASSEGVSVMPRGGGTRMGLGNVAGRADLVLDLGGLDRMVDYQPADMTATVEAGMTLASLQQHLAPGGEFVPLESPLAGRSTVGGVLSVGTGGPLAHAYGLPREWLIGIGVLSPEGVATKAGGTVVKNVTGYDLDKLYTGSMGTLAVIIEASFKLLPVNPEAGALMASFPSVSTAVSAGRKLLHSPVAPMGYHSVTSGVSLRLPNSASLDAGRGEPAPALSLAFYSGRAKATGRRLEESASLLLAQGATAVQRIDGPAVNDLLRWLTDFPAKMSPSSALVMKLSVPSKSVLQASDECGEANLSGQSPEQLADPGFGTIRLIWAKAAGGKGNIGEDSFQETIHGIRQIAQRYGGTAVVEHCPLTVKAQIDVWGDPPDSLAIMQRIKDKFDPNGILNPGRFLGGI
ncbi:MAG: hypothetical protein BZY87_03630 [SAR202 cluster bacterium Io17-Chloro-G6]|nr:MAG: hypothetical protein BZY87_03630 [SAR202 cluster bacterium Io17-Chloro-G6]